EPELVDVEREGFVLVEDIDRRDVELLDHRYVSWDSPVRSEGERQLTALRTRSAMRASSAGTSSLIPYEVGNISPSSIIAASSNPSVAERTPNFDAGLKKTTTLPSFEYAGIP